jgi:hypothetical protein
VLAIKERHDGNSRKVANQGEKNRRPVIVHPARGHGQKIRAKSCPEGAGAAGDDVLPKETLWCALAVEQALHDRLESGAFPQRPVERLETRSDQEAVGKGQAHARGLQSLDQDGQLLAGPDVVLIAGGDDVPAGQTDRLLESARRAQVVLVAIEPDLEGRFLLKLAEHPPSLVHGPIVTDHELVRRPVLPDERFQLLAQKVPSVMGGQDHRDPG